MKTDQDRVLLALRKSLEYLSPAESFWRRGFAGENVTAGELIRMIEDEDPAVDAYIDDVVAVAVRTLRFRSRDRDSVGLMDTGDL